MLQIALENTDRLVRLINDILDIERMESGEVELERRPCDAGQLVHEAADTMRAAADQAGVRLEVGATPVKLRADPDRILQTLTNLLSNAVKFSPEGGTVWVGCEARDGEALFRVCDEGRGVPADKRETIFERFQQVDSSDAREKGGTGLGLAICRSIVEQHGGRIWVDSVEGRGSTFAFTLPATERATAPVTERATAPAAAPRILVCDDDSGVCEVVSAMLERRGYRTIAAASGREALSRAVVERPDAILLDLLMPGLSGWDAGRRGVLGDDVAYRARADRLRHRGLALAEADEQCIRRRSWPTPVPPPQRSDRLGVQRHGPRAAALGAPHDDLERSLVAAAGRDRGPPARVGLAAAFLDIGEGGPGEFGSSGSSESRAREKLEDGSVTDADRHA